VFGVYAPGHDVSRLAYFGLFALQHRGQESAGIATCEGGQITTLRDSGLVSQVFDEEKLRALEGDMAIGHVRYSTTGGGSWENAQPVWRDDGRELALAHNGNLTNAVELWSELKERGISFRGTSDSEIIAALLSSSEGKLIEDAVAKTMPRLEGAYSTVVMTKRAIVAFRDPHGVRPLSLGRLEDRFVVASESCAFDIIGAELMREVHPGEMVSLTERGLETRQVVKAERPALVYLAYPNNPTGVLYDEAAVLEVLRAAEGLVVLDEAYHAFAKRSLMPRLAEFPNLVVMRTVSKLGFAGIRLGYLAARPEWVREFNKVRQAYNVNALTQAVALFALEHLERFEAQAAQIRAERTRLGAALRALGGVTVFPSEANFFLVRVPDAVRTYEALRRQGVLVRNLDPGLANCLRITVGTPDENRILLNALKEAL